MGSGASWMDWESEGGGSEHWAVPSKKYRYTGVCEISVSYLSALLILSILEHLCELTTRVLRVWGLSCCISSVGKGFRGFVYKVSLRDGFVC